MLKHNITDPQELERFESAMRKHFGYADFTKDKEAQYKMLGLTTMAMVWQTAKDEYEESVFTAGDTVYHPTLGKCTVTYVQDDEILVAVFQGNEFKTTQELLSFEPWPLPVHVRPAGTKSQIKDGWWNVRLVTWKGVGPTIRRYVKGHEVYSDAKCKSCTGRVEDYNFIEYIGN